jgi:hypothetical protein
MSHEILRISILWPFYLSYEQKLHSKPGCSIDYVVGWSQKQVSFYARCAEESNMARAWECKWKLQEWNEWIMKTSLKDGPEECCYLIRSLNNLANTCNRLSENSSRHSRIKIKVLFYEPFILELWKTEIYFILNNFFSKGDNRILPNIFPNITWLLFFCVRSW